MVKTSGDHGDLDVFLENIVLKLPLLKKIIFKVTVIGSKSMINCWKITSEVMHLNKCVINL